MRFQRPGGGELRFSHAAIRTMHSHIQRHCWSREAGGILLGRLLVEGEHVVVDEVSVPGPHDRRSRFRFFRARGPAQAVVNEAWTRSGGKLNYLGEWHTHPQDDPAPSADDRRDWRRLVKIQTYEQSSLFFVIVGRRELSAWELSRDNPAAIQLGELQATLAE